MGKSFFKQNEWLTPAGGTNSNYQYNMGAGGRVGGKKDAEQNASRISSTKGFKNMMSSPLMASMLGGLFKKKSTETQSQSNLTPEENKETVNSDESAKFTKIGNGPVRTLRVGDGEADILAKMYNLMQEEYSWDKKKNKKDKKYRKEFDGQKERHLEETIAALTGEQPSKLGRFGRAAKKSGITGLLAKGALGVGIFLLAEKALAKIDWKSIIPDFGDTSQGPGSLDKAKAKEIYDYLTKEKGLSKEQAIGILTNIQAESSFMPGAIGDDGTSGGLFQHHGERFEEMKKFAGPDWQKDWKKQIDFALQEKEGKEYSATKFKSAEEASKSFTEKFERPKDTAIQAEKRASSVPEIEKSLTQPETAATPTTPTGTITGKFGEERGTHKHGGVDIKGKTGDAVVSTNDGTVSQVGFEPNGYGKFVEVDHGNGLKTRYAHLSAFNVSVGDNINKGTKIGEVGNTGHSTGPHLHYELLKDGQKVDPGTALALNPVQPDYKMADADSKYAYVRQQKQIRTAEARMLGVSNRTTNIINGGTTYAYSEEPQVKDGALIQQTFYTR